jgi:hypothetical protein
MTKVTLVVNRWNAWRERNGVPYPNIYFTTQLDALSMISHLDGTIRPHITAHMRTCPESRLSL